MSVLLTQMPTYVGPFRQPWRYLADVGVFLPVLVALGLAYAATVTQAAGSGGRRAGRLQAGLATSARPARLLARARGRARPRGARPPRPGLRRDARSSRRLTALCGAGLVLVTLVRGVLSERAATALNTRYEIENGHAVTAEPSRDLPCACPGRRRAPSTGDTR